jgi:hypothetical protein
MAHLPIIQPTDASKEVEAVYEEFYKRMSFPSPPNFIMTQGHSPAVARGTWAHSRTIREARMVAPSNTHRVVTDPSPHPTRNNSCNAYSNAIQTTVGV